MVMKGGPNKGYQETSSGRDRYKKRQVEVLVGQGQARIDAIRQVQITEQTLYRWRKKYGGMGTAQLNPHFPGELRRWTF